MVMDFWRQADLVREEDLHTPITIIGAGGIGSPTALALAKMGCKEISLYDDDVVDSHNIPNQMYRLSDIGKPKVDALAEILSDFAGIKAEAVRERVQDAWLSGLVIFAVDSMLSRSQVWASSVRFKPDVRLFVDARMGAEMGRIYTIRPCDPDDVAFYEDNLYTDEQATEDPCTARSIIYNVFSIAALIAGQVKRYARNEEMPREIIFDLKTFTLLISS